MEIDKLVVCSTIPKSSPVTVTELSPLCTLFLSAADATAASNENTASPVPARALTVTKLMPKLPLCAAPIHIRDVLELQAAVLQEADDTEAECVMDELPKLRPETVTDDPPLCGPFVAA